MTQAIIAFYKNNEHIGGVYYNSDGYPSYVGKKLLRFLQKETIYNTIEELYGSYILDPDTDVGEINNDKGDVENMWANYNYLVNYDSEQKKIISVSVQSDADKFEFTGTIAEYAAFIKKEL
jgi:hypothetical protein